VEAAEDQAAVEEVAVEALLQFLPVADQAAEADQAASGGSAGFDL
jgi:hypothetical protein